MDLTFNKTKRGGVKSIHFGKIVTTNLFEDEWRIITHDCCKRIIKNYSRRLEICSTKDEENEILEQLTKDIYTYGPLDSWSEPYRRERKGAITIVETPKVEVPIPEEPIETCGITPGPGLYTSLDPVNDIYYEEAPSTSIQPQETDIAKLRKDVCRDILKFFSEFQFVPAVRFINTLSKNMDYDSCCKYINNYMDLIDHPDKNEIKDKITSDEFKNIVTKLELCKSDKQINKRLEILFGPAGTGKTTKAITQYPDAHITVCNELMDSDSIMKVFDFTDDEGHPIFKPSQLQIDMIEGRPHILDEMNLLPLNTLRFLQGILDSKEKINYEGKEIVIKDGFKIIGTMNLIVNGQVFSLPEPIVDRAYNLEEFAPTEDMLYEYSF